MGKRQNFMLFPGGKRKAMTFSYDDGVVQDRRLVEIFNRYAVKGTFNLNSGLLGCQDSMWVRDVLVDVSKVGPGEAAALYAGHEIGGHGLYHSSLRDIGTPLAMHEIIEDRRRLEALIGKQVRMFAYPFGAYDKNVMELLRLAGYAGARTVASTGKFDIPENFLEWNPTCHHNDSALMDLAERFCTQTPLYAPALFYVWGHAYEFDGENNWDVIEKLCQYVSGFGDDIWFATNGQIMDYVTAYRARRYSADGHLVTNPTAEELWMGVGEKTCRILAGETAEINEPGL